VFQIDHMMIDLISSFAAAVDEKIQTNCWLLKGEQWHDFFFETSENSVFQGILYKKKAPHIKGNEAKPYNNNTAEDRQTKPTR
jgi:hypothetical protein